MEFESGLNTALLVVGTCKELLKRCYVSTLIDSLIGRLALVDDESGASLNTDASDELLPDLQKYVDEDNDRFEAELMAWDCEQRKKTSRGSGGTADVSTGDVATTGNPSLHDCCLITSLFSLF